MPSRVQSLKPIKWSMTRTTYNLYLAFTQTMIDADYGSEDWQCALDGIRLLPGWPGPTDTQARYPAEDGLHIQPVLLDVPTVSVLN